MSILNVSSKAAGVAWTISQLINKFLPESQLPIPTWSKSPLKKNRERTAPQLGPRWTQSVCPRCLIEVREKILRGQTDSAAILNNPGTIDAQILEEAGSVLLRKSCDRHGPFQDTLATDAEFFPDVTWNAKDSRSTAFTAFGTVVGRTFWWTSQHDAT
jgi:7,8-dihydro-6-hydroxymethylpterin dimethyltransferase